MRSEQEQSDLAGLLVMAGAFICLAIGMLIVVRGSGRLEDAQRELGARSRLLQATLESLQDPIFVINAHGTVVAWNEPFVRLSGWDPAKHVLLTRELDSDLAGAIELEAMTQALLMRSDDHAEFYRAWNEGRSPRWTGR